MWILRKNKLLVPQSYEFPSCKGTNKSCFGAQIVDQAQLIPLPIFSKFSLLRHFGRTAQWLATGSLKAQKLVRKESSEGYREGATRDE